ncbi:hypothetical protein VP01_800g4 [Puccinia sorghi]|uniref:Uncharacterized protein n=1 Tax=Puccinia sorghi TaxID=27349 RepID=A0A0L6UCM0_9BASI|nr:hypothetical protein VP01_800g4 [Puccinia sorghi]
MSPVIRCLLIGPGKVVYRVYKGKIFRILKFGCNKWNSIFWKYLKKHSMVIIGGIKYEKIHNYLINCFSKIHHFKKHGNACKEDQNPQMWNFLKPPFTLSINTPFHQPFLPLWLSLFISLFVLITTIFSLVSTGPVPKITVILIPFFFPLEVPVQKFNKCHFKDEYCHEQCCLFTLVIMNEKKQKICETLFGHESQNLKKQKTPALPTTTSLPPATSHLIPAFPHPAAIDFFSLKNHSDSGAPVPPQLLSLIWLAPTAPSGRTLLTHWLEILKPPNGCLHCHCNSAWFQYRPCRSGGTPLEPGLFWSLDGGLLNLVYSQVLKLKEQGQDWHKMIYISDSSERHILRIQEHDELMKNQYLKDGVNSSIKSYMQAGSSADEVLDDPHCCPKIEANDFLKVLKAQSISGIGIGLQRGLSRMPEYHIFGGFSLQENTIYLFPYLISYSLSRHVPNQFLDHADDHACIQAYDASFLSRIAPMHHLFFYLMRISSYCFLLPHHILIPVKLPHSIIILIGVSLFIINSHLVEIKPFLLYLETLGSSYLTSPQFNTT